MINVLFGSLCNPGRGENWVMTPKARPRREFSQRTPAGDLSQAIERSTKYLRRGAQSKALEITSMAIALVDAPGTPGLLASLRRGMRAQLVRSRACDSAGLCGELEAHYVEIARLSGVGRRTTRRRTLVSGPERS